MGDQTESQVHASSTQLARKPFQCSLARAPVQRKTIWGQLASTCVGWSNGKKTCLHLRANLSSIKVNVSHRKPSQVRASHGQTESQVNASFQLAITCESVWPGLENQLKVLKRCDQTFFKSFPLKSVYKSYNGALMCYIKCSRARRGNARNVSLWISLIINNNK